MMDAWYSVLSMGFGYLAAVIILLVVVLTAKRHLADQRTYRRLRRLHPQIGVAGEFRVSAGGSRKMPVGTLIEIPYEGTMGTASGCDIVLQIRKLHMRAAFFWAEGDTLHVVPLQKDKFAVDGEPLHPGDEAILRNGALLTIGELTLELQMYGLEATDDHEDPYVTSARRAKAVKGKGRGIGGIGHPQEDDRQKKKKKSSKN